jgi:hypothetical protein
MMTRLSQMQRSSSSNTLDAVNSAFTEVNAEENMMELILNENGLILNCNSVGGKLLGYMTCQLLRQPVSKFLPQLKNTTLVQNGKINPRLCFLSRIGHLFEVASSHGESFPSRLFFNEVENDGQKRLRLVIYPEARAIQPG